MKNISFSRKPKGGKLAYGEKNNTPREARGKNLIFQEATEVEGLYWKNKKRASAIGGEGLYWWRKQYPARSTEKKQQMFTVILL